MIGLDGRDFVELWGIITNGNLDYVEKSQKRWLIEINLNEQLQ